jgi:hypothetical protein
VQRRGLIGKESGGEVVFVRKDGDRVDVIPIAVAMRGQARAAAIAGDPFDGRRSLGQRGLAVRLGDGRVRLCDVERNDCGSSIARSSCSSPTRMRMRASDVATLGTRQRNERRSASRCGVMRTA